MLQLKLFSALEIDIIEHELRELYISGNRPWVVMYSGGKDSTMLLSLIIRVLASAVNIKKQTTILYCDTGVEIPYLKQIAMLTLGRIQSYANQLGLNIDIRVIRPEPTESFFAMMIGRGYTSPMWRYRWCTARLKIRPTKRYMTANPAISNSVILTGSRRDESVSRAVRIKNASNNKSMICPIEYIDSDQVLDYLECVPSLWGDNSDLIDIYRKAYMVRQNARFGCWTCTVVSRDWASEGLLAAGHHQMKYLIDYRNKLIEYSNNNCKRTIVERDGVLRPGFFTMDARTELLNMLLETQKNSGLQLIDDLDIHVINEIWKREENNAE